MTTPTPQRKMLVYPFPLSDGVAQFVIPRDIDQHECDRMCEFLRALVSPNNVIHTPSNKETESSLARDVRDLK